MFDALANRRTFKVLGDTDAPLDVRDQESSKMEMLLEAAGNAPFHHGCERRHQTGLKSPVPWRAYYLDASRCRALMRRLIESGDATKVPAMLAAADYLIQVTWLPDLQPDESRTSDDPAIKFSGTVRNMEHIAAGSAFIQSLLLAGENQGYRTYCSSGGALRGPEVFGWLGIPADQLLLGSVFLFPEDVKDAETKPGAMADKRMSLGDWSQAITDL